MFERICEIKFSPKLCGAMLYKVSNSRFENQLNLIFTAKNMKTLLLLIICTLFVSNCLAQKTPDKDISDDRDLYEVALSACVNEELKYYAKNDPAMVRKKRVVEYNEFTTEHRAPRLGEVGIEYPTSETLRAQYQRNGRGLSILVVRPMQGSGDARLYIEIVEYEFSIINEKIDYAMKGSCDVRFLFDRQKSRFTVNEVQLVGV